MGQPREQRLEIAGEASGVVGDDVGRNQPAIDLDEQRRLVRPPSVDGLLSNPGLGRDLLDRGVGIAETAGKVRSRSQHGGVRMGGATRLLA